MDIRAAQPGPTADGIERRQRHFSVNQHCLDKALRLWFDFSEDPCGRAMDVNARSHIEAGSPREGEAFELRRPERRRAPGGRAKNVTLLCAQASEIVDAPDCAGPLSGLAIAPCLPRRSDGGYSLTTSPVRMLSSAANTMRSELSASAQMVGEIDLAADRPQEQPLLALAKLLMAGLVLGRLDRRRASTKRPSASSAAWWMRSALVRVWASWSDDFAAVARRLPGDDRDAALRPDHVLHEEGGLAHHRPPARLVPADRAVVEDDVEMAVVDHRRRDLVGEPRADRVHREPASPASPGT